MSFSTVSPQGLSSLAARGPIDLLDVRTPVEFREVHVSFARNVPLDSLDPVSLMKSRSSSDPLYLICRSGSRGKQACEKFLSAGFTNVVNVEGGTMACVEAGLPVVRGKKAMSLERQVRIAAGLMILLGVVLAWLVHPAFVGLSAFVGCGLVFAGVTDTCGMGLLLARMPWNRVCTSLLLFALCVPTLNAAEHTKDSLDMVKKAVAAKKAVLVDVREMDEWDDGHLADAKFVPLSGLSKAKAEDLSKVLPKDQPLYLHCASGRRCLKAADELKKLGYDVRPLKAGYNDLLKAGFSKAK